MTITQIIEFLEQLKKDRGDIHVGADFSAWDKDALYYNTELDIIFGE